jgi:hypothetical protein
MVPGRFVQARHDLSIAARRSLARNCAQQELSRDTTPKWSHAASMAAEIAMRRAAKHAHSVPIQCWALGPLIAQLTRCRPPPLGTSPRAAGAYRGVYAIRLGMPATLLAFVRPVLWPL